MSDSDKRWVCAVCGYVHHGPAPPDACPVCGAPASEFHTAVEAPEVGMPAPSRFRCRVCAYVHDGAEPPDRCPVCGAPASEFEPHEGTDEPVGAGSRETRNDLTYVIIGAGIAGVTAAEAIRKQDPSGRIIVISKEKSLPYARLNLTPFLAGQIRAEQLPLHPVEWYEKKGIELITGREVGNIDTETRKVQLRPRGAQKYDRLILATGAHPFMPPIPGITREGVMSLRTDQDCRRLINAASSGGRCICLGGGLLGLETAGALASHGVPVTVIEDRPRLLPRQLDKSGAGILQRRLENIGISFRLGSQVEELVGDERVRGVRFVNDTVIDADIVIVTAGIRPNSYLARAAGIETNTGVVVSEKMETSHPAVWAAGDVAEYQDLIYGLWTSSQKQGLVAGINAAGGSEAFAGMAPSTALKVVDIDVVSVGPVDASGSDHIAAREDGDTYYRFLLNDGRLQGAVIIGGGQLMGPAQVAIRDRLDLSQLGPHPDAEAIVGFLTRWWRQRR